MKWLGWALLILLLLALLAAWWLSNMVMM